MGAIIEQREMSTDYMRRLESQNRMLKRVGLPLFFLCFLAIGLIAWQVKKISRVTTLRAKADVISARQLNLMDDNGNLQGMLEANSDGALLFLNGPNRKIGLMFGSGPAGSTGSNLSLSSSNGEQQISLNTENRFSWVTIGRNEGNGDKVEMRAGAAGQSVKIVDTAGFQAVLGSAFLAKPESGETRQTSVAALTFFGKDGHVIWMTPKP